MHDNGGDGPDPVGQTFAESNEPRKAMYPLGAWDYHSGKELIANSEKKPLGISLHVSDGDNGANSPADGAHNWVVANRRTAEDLAAKEYDYRFLFSKSTRHCDGTGVR